MKKHFATLWNLSERYWQTVVIEDRRRIGGGIVVLGGANLLVQRAAEIYVSLKHCA
jgi:hypothetical protein